MLIISLILLILAAICFGLATVGRTHPSVNFMALGLLFWVLVPLLHTAVRL